MKRVYHSVITSHLKHDEQMVFLAGPRQVGKTTISKTCMPKELTKYLNWDVKEHRTHILKGAVHVAEHLGLQVVKEEKPLVIFDELHKFNKWRDFIKGFYDLYKAEAHIIVTGSAKFDVYNRSGDSLMGRYFPYRIHPLSLREIMSPARSDHLIQPPAAIADDLFNQLWTHGGYPDPFIKNNDAFLRRWTSLRHQQLFDGDIKDLTNIQEIDQLEILATYLKNQACQLLNYSDLSNKIDVSVNTVKRWISTLKNFYFCFTIKPWSKNVTRSLLKEPKVYLWDWSELENSGQRVENFVACHLLKAVQFWTDTGRGDFQLYFVRDKEKREVDFLITKNDAPWILIEAKSSDNQRISEPLHRFYEQLKPQHAFQAVFNMPYAAIDCFSYHKPVIVPLRTLLSQLV